MSTRDKIGVAVLVGLFLALGALLFLTVERGNGKRGFDDNVLIEQRIRNIQGQ